MPRASSLSTLPPRTETQPGIGCSQSCLGSICLVTSCGPPAAPTAALTTAARLPAASQALGLPWGCGWPPSSALSLVRGLLGDRSRVHPGRPEAGGAALKRTGAPILPRLGSQRRGEGTEPWETTAEVGVQPGAGERKWAAAQQGSMAEVRRPSLQVRSGMPSRRSGRARVRGLKC